MIDDAHQDVGCTALKRPQLQKDRPQITQAMLAVKQQPIERRVAQPFSHTGIAQPQKQADSGLDRRRERVLETISPGELWYQPACDGNKPS